MSTGRDHCAQIDEEQNFVAESADKTPSKDQNLEEGSEVVELTDEVSRRAAEADELEALGLEMPEFKMPEDNDSQEDQEDSGGHTTKLSSEALKAAVAADDERRRSDAEGDKAEPDEAQADKADDAPSASAQSDVDDEVDVEEGLGEPAYDRQAMVKTIQIEAFDRASVEAMGQSAEGGPTSMLQDARFAPEIIIEPPPVLVKKWREGLPSEVEAIVGKKPAAEPPPSQEEDSFEEIDLLEEGQVISDEAASEEQADDENQEAKAGLAEDGESPPSLPISEPAPDTPPVIEAQPGLGDEESEPIELSDELVELEEDSEEEELVLEPLPQSPQKSTQKSAPSAPPEVAERVTAPDPPPESTEQAAPRTRQQNNRPPKAAKPQEQRKPESEMQGLVQELLAEEKEQKGAKTAKIRPRDVWFTNVFTDEYLRSIPPNISKVTADDADFIERSLRLKKKSRILDLACGFGRHSIELATRGYEMVGLDISRPLLERALEVAQKRSLSIKFIRGDMRELNFSGIFDGCFIWDTSLGYFDDRRNLGVLQGVARALKPGGRLLIDVVNRDFVVPRTPTRLWWEGTGCIFLEESEFDYHTSTLEVQRSFIYEDGSPPIEQTSYIRLYSIHELRQMLHVAGFQVIEVSGAKYYRGHFLGSSSERLIVLAQRRKNAKRRPTNRPQGPPQKTTSSG